MQKYSIRGFIYQYWDEVMFQLIHLCLIMVELLIHPFNKTNGDNESLTAISETLS